MGIDGGFQGCSRLRAVCAEHRPLDRNPAHPVALYLLLAIGTAQQTLVLRLQSHLTASLVVYITQNVGSQRLVNCSVCGSLPPEWYCGIAGFFNGKVGGAGNAAFQHDVA